MNDLESANSSSFGGCALSKMTLSNFVLLATWWWHLGVLCSFWGEKKVLNSHTNPLNKFPDRLPRRLVGDLVQFNRKQSFEARNKPDLSTKGAIAHIRKLCEGCVRRMLHQVQWLSAGVHKPHQPERISNGVHQLVFIHCWWSWMDISLHGQPTMVEIYVTQLAKKN